MTAEDTETIAHFKRNTFSLRKYEGNDVKEIGTDKIKRKMKAQKLLTIMKFKKMYKKYVYQKALQSYLV